MQEKHKGKEVSAVTADHFILRGAMNYVSKNAYHV